MVTVGSKGDGDSPKGEAKRGKGTRKRQRGASKGEQTRERILDVALAAFRERGFDAATMRDIAKEAGMSLGAAYYYFPSKDALVQAYYERTCQARCDRARAAFENCTTLRERLQAVYDVHLELVGPDRRLLGALTRFVANPESEVSVFSDATKSLRNKSLDLFYETVSVEEVPEPLRDFGALGLWALDLGLMLYLAWDESPDQQRSRKLITDVLDMLMPVLPLLSLPIAEPLLQRLAQVLLEAQLIPAEDDDEDDDEDG